MVILPLLVIDCSTAPDISEVAKWDPNFGTTHALFGFTVFLLEEFIWDRTAPRRHSAEFPPEASRWS